MKQEKHANNSTNAEALTTAGAAHLTILRPSDAKHSPHTRPHSFASPHRTHDTHTKRNRETNFPIGGLLRRSVPFNLRYMGGLELEVYFDGSGGLGWGHFSKLLLSAVQKPLLFWTDLSWCHLCVSCGRVAVCIGF